MKSEDTLRIAIVIVYGMIGFLFGFFIISPFLRAHSAEVQPRSGATSPRYKIAILDTGYDPARAAFPAKLCKTGHYDFSTHTANINYVNPHGTQVASIIAEKLKDVDYCLVIFQLFDAHINVPAIEVAQALNDAIGLGVTAINLSFGGRAPEPLERGALLNVSNAKIETFAAAGNSGQNLDMNCNYYPACYKFKNMIVVGAQDPELPKQHDHRSNYGKAIVDVWARGDYSMGDNEADYNFGTSFATPRALAEYILFLEHKRLAAQGKK